MKEEKIFTVKGYVEQCIQLLEEIELCEKCHETIDQTKELLERIQTLIEGDELLGDEPYYKDSEEI